MDAEDPMNVLETLPYQFDHTDFSNKGCKSLFSSSYRGYLEDVSKVKGMKEHENDRNHDLDDDDDNNDSNDNKTHETEKKRLQLIERRRLNYKHKSSYVLKFNDPVPMTGPVISFDNRRSESFSIGSSKMITILSLHPYIDSCLFVYMT